MALRQIQPHVLRLTLPSVRMWRDDLSEMVHLVREVAKGGQVTITADNYELDTIDDLADIRVDRVGEISISASDGDIVVHLGKSNTLEVKEPDLKAHGMVSAVVALVKRCSRSWTHRSHGAVLAVLATALFVLGTWSVAIVALSSGQPVAPLSLIFFGLCVAVGFATGFRAPYRKSVLHTKTRIEAPTFWRRKRDDITITLASNAISLALGGMLGYWINMITS